MSQLTKIIEKINGGDSAAAEELLSIVYDELRLLAEARLKREESGQTLQPTALVHEAYIRLVDAEEQQQWDSPGHLFSAAAEAMRRILVERARKKQSIKRGGDRRKISLDHLEPVTFDRMDEIVAIHESLDMLSQHDAQAAELVKLRYFAGLGHQEAAAALGISRRVADRLWVAARAWLFNQIKRT